MAAITGAILDEEVPRARVAVLLKHFSQLGDDREPWRVMYPLDEVMLLVTCATIASCDDFDDMCAWGRHHLDFLRGFSEFHHGIPCERWFASSSIGSIRSCSDAALRVGWRRCGRTGTTSSPSTARPRGAPTTAARGSKPCTRSALTRPRHG